MGTNERTDGNIKKKEKEMGMRARELIIHINKNIEVTKTVYKNTYIPCVECMKGDKLSN